VTDSYEAARVYAWNWFEYHASQRMTVFRFYLIFTAVIAAGYAQVIDKAPLTGAMLGGFLSFITIAFWRLDRRNVALIKLAEAHLKDHENRLALEVGPGVKFLGHADQGQVPFSSFSGIFRLVFLVVFLMGGIAAAGPFLAAYM